MSQYFVDPGECARHRIFPGVEIHTACGEQIMLSLVEFEPHAVVEAHQHPHEQMGLLLEGELEFFIGDEHLVVRPGQMWRIPGGIVHRAVAGPQRVRALDVFCPIRDDYR